MNTGIIFALLTAALFGASTPLAKFLSHQITPVTLAGLLYAGAGLGLLAWLLVSRIFFKHRNTEANLTRADIPWLAGAIVCGGVIAPIMLMFGVRVISAANASLLMNIEGVFTAALAWCVFNEKFDRRMLLSMAFIMAAGVLLSWQEGWGTGMAAGNILVIAACFGWAIDNNLTRKISASNPVQIVCVKSIVSAVVNLSIAFAMGEPMPAPKSIIWAGLIGWAGYGLSLVFFVLALRTLGAARTGAYFSVAPFFGVAVAVLCLHEQLANYFWLAGFLMCIGIALHMTEGKK